MTSQPSPIIYCAIDTPDLTRATELTKAIGPVTGGIKLGLEFFSSFGPAGIEKICEACPDANIFMDMKFHDIPNTVAGAVRTISTNLAPAYLNVHASGGYAMMKAAKDACAKDTKLLAVTILTSLDETALAEIGYAHGPAAQVKQLASLTQSAGLDGVVCSSLEIEELRKTIGDNFILMVPGIRPQGSDTGDQKRVMTPTDAIKLGATHLVIGRPITGADDPAQAAQDILDDLAA